MFQRLTRVAAAPFVVLGKHHKKVLAVPLAAVVIATGLALAPTTDQDVPVLSTLGAEEASAHDLTRPIGLPYPKRVCEWNWERVQVVIHYVDEFGNGPYPGPGRRYGPPLFPVFAWKQELVETCHWELVFNEIPVSHHHLTERQCEYTLLVLGVAVGVFPSAWAARLAAAALGFTIGTFSIEGACEMKEYIVYAPSPGV